MVHLLPTKELRKKLVTELGIETLSEDYQNEIVSQMEDNIIQKLYISILEKLTEKERKDFGILTALREGDKVMAFLKIKIPDFDIFLMQVAKLTIEEFKSIRSSGNESDLTEDELAAEDSGFVPVSEI